MRPNEEYALAPDDTFRIGLLEFQTQRFNTGVLSDIGQRAGMEDSYQIIQDLRLDSKIPVSYFAVFDGHGGYQCAVFLRQYLHLNLVKAFLRRRNGGLQNLIEADNFFEVIDELIGEAFLETDLQY